MPEGPVIVNNTPLSALWAIDHLTILRELYHDILIPQAVYEEFLATHRPARQKVLDESPWILPVSLAVPQQTRVYIGLDLGEAEVLALAMERSARLVIIDERRGRRYAKRLGLSLTGTVGVLLAAKEAGLIPLVTPLLEDQTLYGKGCM